MSFEAARIVLRNKSIGFTCLEDFNDPFECTAFGFTDIKDSVVTVEGATNACRNRFSRKYAVLSLTRQPLNPLMWAHYGDSHRGIVIGFDITEMDFFNTDKWIQYGEMIYTATKPHKDLEIPSQKELLSIGNGVQFDSHAFNIVKRAFLYKAIEWAYEEEVRIVADIKDFPAAYHSGEKRHKNWTKMMLPGRSIYCLDIPDGAIKEIYIGKHSRQIVSRLGKLSNEDYQETIRHWSNIAELYKCDSEISSWGMKISSLKTES